MDTTGTKYYQAPLSLYSGDTCNYGDDRPFKLKEETSDRRFQYFKINSCIHAAAAILRH